MIYDMHVQYQNQYLPTNKLTDKLQYMDWFAQISLNEFHRTTKLSYNLSSSWYWYQFSPVPDFDGLGACWEKSSVVRTEAQRSDIRSVSWENQFSHSLRVTLFLLKVNTAVLYHVVV